MLYPRQFKVNEAWVAFRINGAPVRTVSDGDFNCITLVDAASCYMLSGEFIPVGAAEPSQLECRRLLEAGRRHKQELPKTLFVPEEDLAREMTREATEQGIEVVRVPERELAIFIREAREEFAKRFEDPPLT